MRKVGACSKTSMADVFRKIVSQELSGDLQIISGRSIRVLYFSRGFLVFAASNLEKDRLGSRLLKAGRVTETELEQACRRTKGKRRIGEAFVEAGLLSQDELGREVARQVKQIVLSVYSLNEGIYSFDERESWIPMNLRLSLSVFRIQLEGIRQISRPELIIKGIGSFKRRVQPSKLPPFSLEESELSATERAVLEVAETPVSTNAILERVEGQRIDVLKAIYGLLRAGILERPSGKGRTRQVQEEMGTFLLSNLDNDVSQLRTDNVRHEVLLTFDGLGGATPSELLRIEETADLDSIQQAFDAQLNKWKKKQALVYNERSLYVKVDEIRRRLAQAYANMVENKKPHAETTQINTKSPGEDTFEIPVEFDDFFETRDESPLDPVESEADAGDSKSGPTQDEIDNLLYEIEIRKNVNDSDIVISLLYELVQLVPQNATYESMLAEALASHSILRKKAERHFWRAIELEPQNADLHFALGNYYLLFDMKPRALSEFKTSVRIDPDHVLAQKALLELKKDPTPMEQAFQRLFR